MMMVTGGGAGATMAGLADGGFHAGAVAEVGGSANGRGCQTRLDFAFPFDCESAAWTEAVTGAIR
ncbi:hypothetical protein, partial [Rhodopirellula bahusiensis]|uniref:hypothetical protein n=1 Tax=Rhodopirellula bahusiensis TaxID=2014065 RepID=UPI003267CD30